MICFRALGVLAGLLLLAGCRGPVTCNELQLGPRPTLRGVGVGDPFEPSRFAIVREPYPWDGVPGRVGIGIGDGVQVVLGGVTEWDAKWDVSKHGGRDVMTDEQIDALVQGARVELIELSTANNDRLDQELRACLKGGAIKDGEVVGTFSAFMDLRRTNVAGLYAEAIVERVGGAARISGLYLGPDVESLRASGVAKMRDSVQTDAERKRELARALDDNERRAIARNRADEVQQAEARVQAKLSPAEEERLATLTKAAGEADKNYQWAARNSTDWRKLKEAIYSAAGTSGLEVEEAARVHYMGQAAWDEWRALLSRRSVAAGR